MHFVRPIRERRIRHDYLTQASDQLGAVFGWNESSHHFVEKRQQQISLAALLARDALLR